MIKCIIASVWIVVLLLGTWYAVRPKGTPAFGVKRAVLSYCEPPSQPSASLGIALRSLQRNHRLDTQDIAPKDKATALVGQYIHCQLNKGDDVTLTDLSSYPNLDVDRPFSVALVSAKLQNGLSTVLDVNVPVDVWVDEKRVMEDRRVLAVLCDSASPKDCLIALAARDSEMRQLQSPGHGSYYIALSGRR